MRYCIHNDSNTKKPDGRLRVLLADDQPDVRSALRLLLEQNDHYSIAGEVYDESGLQHFLMQECPDMVLLDWELPGKDGLQTLLALRQACPRPMVIVLSGRPEARREALDAGADLFVSKSDPPEQLLLALRSCQNNHGHDAVSGEA